MSSGSLEYLVRPAAGQADGALVLFHGRGASEDDLYPLLDMLDPERRLVGVTPRGPLSLPPGGAHWYVVRQVGFPDPATFGPTFDLASHWLDDLAAETGIPPERTVLGGFSQGAVMAHSLGLGTGRPRPAGIVALSGFIPVVEGWQPDLASRQATRVFIAHGRRDPVMEVGFARRAREQLEAGGLDVEYHESDAAHHIDPAHVEPAVAWLGTTLG